jgi:putative glutathione S-transferase
MVDVATTSTPLPGSFVRLTSTFRDWVTADGSSGYPAESGRYHLYVSLACPWAHRTVIVRRLKHLEDVVSLSIVDPIRDERGWAFTGAPRTDLDALNGFHYLAEAYLASEPDAPWRVTVPVLWDKQTHRIVNNESADIIRMLGTAFDAYTDVDLGLYPADVADEIDVVNARVYDGLNNAVYRAGFGRTQGAYDAAVHDVFDTLDWLDERLTDRRYLVGSHITEADWRLFTTLVRFDPVYVTHFRCDRRRIVDYPALSGYLRELYAVPGVAETVDFDQIRRHYFLTHRELNPRGILPIGPVLDLSAPHGREALS